MTDERAMRFRLCLEQIETRARKLRLNEEPDIFHALFAMREALEEAEAIFGEVSREALDKTVIRLKDPPPADTEIVTVFESTPSTEADM